MRESDKALLREFAGFVATLAGGTFALMFLWRLFPQEGVALQVVSAFGLVFAVVALGDLTRGALDGKARGQCWSEALWHAAMGTELFAVLFLARPLLRDMGVPRLFLLLTGFYVWNNGTVDLAGSLKARPLRGGRHLIVGLVAMSAALLLPN